MVVSEMMFVLFSGSWLSSVLGLIWNLRNRIPSEERSFQQGCKWLMADCARVAELADALDSGSSE